MVVVGAFRLAQGKNELFGWGMLRAWLCLACRGPSSVP